MFDSLLNAAARVLNALYGLTNSYALAIALLTFALMVLVLPLNLKSTRSMIELQRVQPLLKRIQDEHKGDRAAQQEAMMKLYSEHKVNPVGGCLPMLLQAPVFMILWRVLSGLTRTCAGAKQVSETCAADSFLPSHLSEGQELYRSLKGKTEMLSFGLDLAKAPYKVIGDNIVRGLPYLLLVILVGGLSYYGQRQVMSRNKSSDMTAQQRQQQALMSFLPIVFSFVSLTFASGLLMYMLVSNGMRVLMNSYITHKYYGDNRPEPIEVPELIAKPKPKPDSSAPASGKPRPRPSKPSTGKDSKPAPPAKRATSPKGGTASRPTPPSKRKPKP